MLTIPSPPAAQIAAKAAAPSDGTDTGPELTQLVERAKKLLDGRDVRTARLLLERAVGSGSGEGAFYLAETFDSRQIARLRLRGVSPDNARARDLYATAARAGIAEAGRRLRDLPE